MFVLRSWHHEVVSILKAQVASERENAQMLRKELIDLRGKYHQLKASGYKDAPEAPVKVEQPVVDEVTRAVNLASRGNKQLRASMLAQVARDRSFSFTDEQIIERIRRGNSDDSIEAFAAVNA